MPDGEGVAAVFEPLERGQELLERILPVYESTAGRNAEILESGYAPGYFCPPAQSEAEARQSGEKLLENLRGFARFIEDEELAAALADIREIRFGEPDDEDNETEIINRGLSCGMQEYTSVRTQTPVVMFSRTINTSERLLVQ